MGMAVVGEVPQQTPPPAFRRFHRKTSVADTSPK